MLADDIDSDDMLPKLNSTSEEEDMEGDMEEDMEGDMEGNMEEDMEEDMEGDMEEDMEGDMDDFELKLNDTTEEEED